MLSIKRALMTSVVAVGALTALPALASVAISTNQLDGLNFNAARDGAHLATTVLGQSFVNGNGQNAQAYGSVTAVNGLSNYCSYEVSPPFPRSTQPCSMFYVSSFTNSQHFSSSYVEFTAATISLYVGYPALHSLDLSGKTSPAIIRQIQGMSPWLTLTGHNNLGGATDPLAVLIESGVLSGSSISGSGFGLFDVNAAGPGNAQAKGAVNLNGEPDAIGRKADFTWTPSFNNSAPNPNDVNAGLANGCKTGTAVVGAWCYSGNASLDGDVAANVPEPSMMGLIGLSMLGVIGLIRRRTS